MTALPDIVPAPLARGPGTLESTLDRIEATDLADDLTLGDLLDVLGPTGALPVMMLLGLVLVSPLSGVPLFATCVGLAIAASAWQMLAGRPRVRLPGFLSNRRMSGRRLGQITRGARGTLRRLDGLTVSGRLAFLTGVPARAALGALMLLIGLVMPALEFIPFSSSIFGASVLLMSLGLLARDGLWIIAGLMLVGVAVSIAVSVATMVAT